jgi:hypothetical protein
VFHKILQFFIRRAYLLRFALSVTGFRIDARFFIRRAYLLRFALSVTGFRIDARFFIRRAYLLRFALSVTGFRPMSSSAAKGVCKQTFCGGWGRTAHCFRVHYTAGMKNNLLFH